MSIEEQLRALGDHLDEVQEPITVDELRRGAGADTHVVTSPRGRLLLIAAVVILVVGGVLSLVALSANDEDPLQPVDSGAITVPDTTAPAAATTAPAAPTTSIPQTTVTPQAASGWSGGLLDDLDTESLRPLDSYTEGDVIVPTAPSDWRVSDSGVASPGDGSTIRSHVTIIEAQPVTIPMEPVPFGGQPTDRTGQRIILSVTRNPECGDTRGCSPSGPPVTIGGIEWQSFAAEDDPNTVPYSGVRAGLGDLWVWVIAPPITEYESSGDRRFLGGFDDPMLEEPTLIEFLEGLRVGSPEVLAAIGESCWQCGVAGAEGDPFVVKESPTATPTTTSDGAPTATSVPQAQAPSGVDGDTGRPLTDLADGDVLVPTYIPPGLALEGEARLSENPVGSEFMFTVAAADGQPSIAVRLWEDGPLGPLGPAELDDPNHPPVEIAGLTWGWYDFEMARIANIGPFSVWVSLRGLDEVEAVWFIEGLRAASIEQFPGPIQYDTADGLSVVDGDDLVGAEVVASEDDFELAALGVGDQVCTKLTHTTVPATSSFASNCTESARLYELGIVDLLSLDETDGESNTT
jgi:hypothetical protein